MAGETDLTKLIKEMRPELNPGEYVFSSVQTLEGIAREDVIGEFKEKEGITVILERQKADGLKLPYAYIASWITLTIHSSLDAVGLTALFATALAKHNISCNVMAGYYHDHIFVDKNQEEEAMKVLTELSEGYSD